MESSDAPDTPGADAARDQRRGGHGNLPVALAVLTFVPGVIAAIALVVALSGGRGCNAPQGAASTAFTGAAIQFVAAITVAIMNLAGSLMVRRRDPEVAATFRSGTRVAVMSILLSILLIVAITVLVACIQL